MNRYINNNNLNSTEALLYESEQKYQRLVENAMFGLIIFDMNNIYFSNKYIEENLGYSKEDFWKCNLTIWDILTDEYRKKFYPVAQKCFINKTTYSERFISELMCKDGEIRTFEVAVSSIYFNGKYTFQGNFIDITHFYKAQEQITEKINQLEKLEKKHRSLLENLKDGFILVNTGFKIMQLNQALAQMLEYEIAELEGRCLLDFAAYPRDVIALLTGMKRRLRYMSDNYELNLRTKSGQIIPTYISPAPLVEDDKVTGCFAIIKDLTTIKATEHQLAYQARVLANLSEGILITDENGILTYINKGAQKILNINCEDFLNFPATNLTALFGLNIDLEQFFTNINSNNIWQTEVGFLNFKKEQIFVRISVTPIKDMYNTFKGLIIVISDLTEILLSKQAAEKANLAKTNFLANVSHDIRTPMIGIIGAADLLNQEKLTPYQTELVQTIKQCGEQLLELINDILDLSRIEAGYTLGSKKNFKLDQVISECIQTVYGKIPENVNLYAYIAPEVPLNLTGDPLQLRRIILNLLSNAIKFTSQGEIRIDINLHQENLNFAENTVYLLFSIADTGIGIPDDKLNLIFEAFEKIDLYSQSGTGLGLTICKQLVKNMGGDIWAESTLGSGSKFSFYLPFLKPEKAENKTEQDNMLNLTSPKSLSNNKSILLVEDNNVNRKILSYMLSNAGYNVTAVEDGMTCLIILKKKQFDLIIMDMQMPILDGYETCKRIRQEHGDDTPILALTAFSMEGDEIKCFNAGCNYYLPKPVSAEQLYNKIQQIFAENLSSDTDDVQLDEYIIKNLIPEFLDNLGDLILGIKKGLEIKDTEMLASIAHDIKGTAGMYGFNYLSKLAGEIQKEAISNNITKINEIYEDILHNIEHIKRFL